MIYTCAPTILPYNELEEIMEVIIASPRGFCAGVVRAIEVVEKSLDTFDKPVYVRKEIVHNPHVVQQLRDKGAIFVDEIEEVPEGQTVVFVETEEGFAAVPVGVGRTNRTHVEILHGVAAAQRYVAKGAFVLKSQLAKSGFASGHNH